MLSSEFDFFGFSYDPAYTDDSEVVVLNGMLEMVWWTVDSIEFGEVYSLIGLTLVNLVFLIMLMALMVVEYRCRGVDVINGTLQQRLPATRYYLICITTVICIWMG